MVLVKLKLIVIFNLPSPVVFAFLSWLFLKLENKTEMVLRLKKHGPLVDRHHLLSLLRFCGLSQWDVPSIVTQVDPGFCFTHGVHIQHLFSPYMYSVLARLSTV